MKAGDEFKLVPAGHGRVPAVPPAVRAAAAPAQPAERCSGHATGHLQVKSNTFVGLDFVI